MYRYRSFVEVLLTMISFTGIEFRSTLFHTLLSCMCDSILHRNNSYVQTLVVTIILYLHILFAGCFTWTQSDNTGVFGGTPISGVTTIAACQAACINNRTCVAIDFDSSGCYFVLSATSNIKVPRTGITHFDLVTGSGCK